MKQRLIDCGRSFRSLPLWVQLWVGLFLVPVNAAPFLLPDTYSGLFDCAPAATVAASLGECC